MGTSYYKTQLTKQQQTIYDAIVASLRKYQSKITLASVPAESIDRAFAAVRLDRPELFFLDNNSTVYYSVFKSELGVSFCYSFQETKRLLDELNRRAKEIVSKSLNMSLQQRAIYLHDYLVGHLTYSEKINNHNEAHNIVGALLHRSCVCEGYAKAYKFLCDKAGIPCIIVMGTSLDEKNVREGHAWNIVMPGQTCFHVDPTFDNFIDGEYCSHAHVFLSSKEILTNHTVDSDFSIPNCPESQLPMVRVSDLDAFIAAVRQDQRKKLRFSEYALTSYVAPHEFIDAFRKKLSVFDLALHNQIRSFFFSDCPKVNVIGIKWR